MTYWGTHSDDKDGLQSGANEDKDAGAQNEGGTDLLDETQAGTPEKRKGNDNKVDVGCDVRGEGSPDDGTGDGGLATVAWVGVDLPVFVEGHAADEDGQDGGEPAGDDDHEPSVDSHAVTTTEAVLDRVSNRRSYPGEQPG